MTKLNTLLENAISLLNESKEEEASIENKLDKLQALANSFEKEVKKTAQEIKNSKSSVKDVYHDNLLDIIDELNISLKHALK